METRKNLRGRRFVHLLLTLAVTASVFGQQLRLEWSFETPVTEDHVFRDIAVNKSSKLLYITDSQADQVLVYRNDGSREPVTSFGHPSWRMASFGPYGIDVANDNEIYVAVASVFDSNGDGARDHALWRCDANGRNLTRLCTLPDFPRGIKVMGEGPEVVVYVDGSFSKVIRCTPIDADNFRAEVLFSTCVLFNQQDVFPNRAQNALYVSSWMEGTNAGCGMPVTKWDLSGVRDPRFSTAYFPWGNCAGIGLDPEENYLYVYVIRQDQFEAVCKLDATTGSLISSVRTGPGGTWGGGGMFVTGKGEIYFARTLTGPATGPFISSWGKVVDQGGGGEGQPIADNYDIYAVDARTGSTVQVTWSPDAAEYNPTWSNDGRLIAHDRLTSTQHDIYVTDVTTHVSSPLAGAEGGNDAAWSPNGQLIAFDRVPQGDNNIYVVPASGGERRLVVVDAVDASWAPNGKMMAFHRPSDGSLRTVHVGGDNVSLLVVSGSNPAWSPDGRWIAFSAGGELWKVRVNGSGAVDGSPVLLTAGPGYKSQPSWSQDHRTLVFHSDLGGSDFDLWTIPATGGEPSRLTGLVDHGDYDPSFSNRSLVAFAGYTVAPPLIPGSGGAAALSPLAVVPSEVQLGQNYPNPFNPTTAISYQLSAVSNVSLKIFDILGREVAVLVDEVRSAGTHTVTWDATKVPSGMYFYTLQSGEHSETKKLLLMR